MNVLLTGATGLVGKAVGKELVRQGHRVFVVSRDKDRAILDLPFPAHIIEGDLALEPLRDDRLLEVDSVIHLAGENIARRRWSSKQKRKIYDSRVKSSQNLLEALTENKNLRTFISASAVGFYGDRGDEVLTESSSRGHGFLSEVCQDWEQSLQLAQRKSRRAGFRPVILRFGLVLSPLGGALERMLMAVRLGLGGKIGQGRQWMSWIHIDDLVSLILMALTDPEVHGVINAVAPEAVTNSEFMKATATVFGKKLGPPVPRLFLKMALGEMSQLLLYSQRVQSEATAPLNFTFRFAQLRMALEDIFARGSGADEFFFSEQYLPYASEKIFPFFSEARNLERIIPRSMNFKVTKMSSNEIQRGTLITYRLKVRGIPIHWVTEISDWQPPQEFTDLQLKGPYSSWSHRHRFEAMSSGTLMTDVVRFRVPLGVLGRWVAAIWIRRELQSIFQFRREVVAEIRF